MIEPVFRWDDDAEWWKANEHGGIGPDGAKVAPEIVQDYIANLETENATLQAKVLERAEERDTALRMKRVSEGHVIELERRLGEGEAENTRLREEFEHLKTGAEDYRHQATLLRTEVAGLRKALKSFVDDFESDFVVGPDESGTALIVGGPGEMWGPIVRLYEQAKAALAARETEGDELRLATALKVGETIHDLKREVAGLRKAFGRCINELEASGYSYDHPSLVWYRKALAASRGTEGTREGMKCHPNCRTRTNPTDLSRNLCMYCRDAAREWG